MRIVVIQTKGKNVELGDWGKDRLVKRGPITVGQIVAATVQKDQHGLYFLSGHYRAKTDDETDHDGRLVADIKDGVVQGVELEPLDN